MLVITRHMGQRLVIDGNIVITVVDIGRGKVRLGIEADRSVPVWREELVDVDRGQQEAAT